MELNKLKVSVIGCGWLGRPLCESLMNQGRDVITTTPTSEKATELASKFNIQLFDVTQDIARSELLNSDVIIYTIPPLGLGEVQNFFKTIKPDQKIIFISSTAVYGKNQGEVTEDSPFEPSSKNALVLREAESYLKDRFKHLTIIRPGGLYEEKRHPVYFLAGRNGITSGEEYLHLVHRDDCVNAIVKIVELNLFGEDFNLVSDLRILKKDYYTEMAKKLGLVAPLYETQIISNPTLNPTKISNDKSKKILSLQYINPLNYA